MNKNIYLDYNSHTPCDPQVIESMNSIWNTPGNPHSVGHFFGWTKSQAIDAALKSISDIYDCFEEELLFTSGATEANNLAIFSGIKLAQLSNANANTILASHIEHASVLTPLKLISKKLGLKLVYVDINIDGTINTESLEYNLNKYNVLWLSCTMTNGVIGTNQPIEQVSALCNKFNVIFHVDASQSGYLPISCIDLNVDFLTLSAHKIYGPSGIGLLYSKHLKNPNFMPMITGGGQQAGLRSGTLPTPLIVGFQRASEIMEDKRKTEAEHLRSLRNVFLEELSKELEVEVIGNFENRHPGNLFLAIKGTDSMQLLNNLQPHVAFSLGSACDGLNRKHSSLMQAIGVSKQKAEASFRISVGRMSTIEQIFEATSLIVHHAKKLQ